MTLNEAWPIAVVAVTAAVGYGELRAKVKQLTNDLNAGLATKASRELLDAHYREIIARLERIECNLDEARNARGKP